MSELDRLLSLRRSVREYKPEIPEMEILHQLIQAASQAPSPSNSRPVRFIRINSEKKKNALRASMEHGFRELLKKREQKELSKRLNNWINAYWRFSDFMFNAPVLMAVGRAICTEGFKGKLQDAGLLDPVLNHTEEMEISVGLAIQNYILKATEVGLGTCILTAPLVFNPRPENTLGVEKIDISCFLTTGYPLNEPDTKSFEEPLQTFSTI